jgi:ankyrin repeat protein
MYELHRAAKYGDIARSRELLLTEAGKPDVNAFDSAGLTPLMYAIRAGSVESVKLLLAAGASVHQESKSSYESGSTVLALAVGAGDPEIVAILIEAGADIRYWRDGYDVLIDAVHGRDVFRDSRLVTLLSLLIAKDARTDTITKYGESVLRVLSRIGRFDAVKILLRAGADESHLSWTPLIKAIALGGLADVEAEIAHAALLEDRDYWERTAWLVAIQTGDIKKAKLLLDKGADRHAVGRCSQPALFYAIQSQRIAMLHWLLSIGADVEQADEFEKTPLMTAVEYGSLEAVELLLNHGAAIDRQRAHEQSALSDCRHTDIAQRLLCAGADPRGLSFECRRAMLGLSSEPESDLLDVAADEFYRGQMRRFGVRNGEEIFEPFWQGMIRSGINAYQAARLFSESDRVITHPVWCAQRFGQSLTFLPDGRIIQIGGEHEDAYDPDFCIYNDVFVHEPDGTVRIFAYPDSAFPCTDFHTATLVGSEIWIVGSLGYHGTRRYGETPVYALDTQSLQMRRVTTSGSAPGWIQRHRAVLSGEELQVSGGSISSMGEGGEAYAANGEVFVLNTRTLEWRRQKSASQLER